MNGDGALDAFVLTKKSGSFNPPAPDLVYLPEPEVSLLRVAALMSWAALRHRGRRRAGV